MEIGSMQRKRAGKGGGKNGYLRVMGEGWNEERSDCFCWCYVWLWLWWHIKCVGSEEECDADSFPLWLDIDHLDSQLQIDDEYNSISRSNTEWSHPLPFIISSLWCNSPLQSRSNSHKPTHNTYSSPFLLSTHLATTTTYDNSTPPKSAQETNNHCHSCFPFVSPFRWLNHVESVRLLFNAYCSISWANE